MNAVQKSFSNELFEVDKRDLLWT